ncbi:unnamed protein product [marine sediment metagenome]|uniref:Uncharacterized protein n=1 Tax=marine sediment metagenome TaxID=412755 RepID=X1IH85_9ZZZZ
MTYAKLTKACKDLNMDYSPIKKSVEIKEDKIVLYREKLVVEKDVSYKEVDEIIEKLQEYFKERMIVFYKCSKEYSKDIDEPVQT